MKSCLQSVADSSSAKTRSLNKEQILPQSNNSETAGASMPEETQPSTSAEIFPGESETENDMNTVVPNVNDSSTHDLNGQPANNSDLGLNSVTDNSVNAGGQTRTSSSQPVNSSAHILPSPHAFDSWIDNLTEFQETVILRDVSEMYVAQALYKFEASKDTPSIEFH